MISIPRHGSFPMNNKINELNPKAIESATNGAEKLAILNLSFIFLTQSYNLQDLLERLLPSLAL